MVDRLTILDAAAIVARFAQDGDKINEPRANIDSAIRRMAGLTDRDCDSIGRYLRAIARETIDNGEVSE